MKRRPNAAGGNLTMGRRPRAVAPCEHSTARSPRYFPRRPPHDQVGSSTCRSVAPWRVCSVMIANGTLSPTPHLTLWHRFWQNEIYRAGQITHGCCGRVYGGDGGAGAATHNKFPGTGRVTQGHDATPAHIAVFSLRPPPDQGNPQSRSPPRQAMPYQSCSALSDRYCRPCPDSRAFRRLSLTASLVI